MASQTLKRAKILAEAEAQSKANPTPHFSDTQQCGIQGLLSDSNTLADELREAKRRLQSDHNQRMRKIDEALRDLESSQAEEITAKARQVVRESW